MLLINTDVTLHCNKCTLLDFHNLTAAAVILNPTSCVLAFIKSTWCRWVRASRKNLRVVWGCIIIFSIVHFFPPPPHTIHKIRRKSSKAFIGLMCIPHWKGSYDIATAVLSSKYQRKRENSRLFYSLFEFYTMNKFTTSKREKAHVWRKAFEIFM